MEDVGVGKLETIIDILFLKFGSWKNTLKTLTIFFFFGKYNSLVKILQEFRKFRAVRYLIF